MFLTLEPPLQSPDLDFRSHSLTPRHTDEKAGLGEATWQVSPMQLGPEKMVDIAKGSHSKRF